MRKTLIATLLLTSVTAVGRLPPRPRRSAAPAPSAPPRSTTSWSRPEPPGPSTGTMSGHHHVASNATLKASAVTVKGNVQAEGARSVQVMAGSTVDGSVQVVQGRGAKIVDSTIGADILFDTDRARVTAARNDVGGNVQAFANTGGVVISRNTIDGNLQCKENTPAPTGGSNIVGGSKEDQCAAL